MSSPAAVATATRQYRCQKRQKPCDHCRERKLKCQTDNTNNTGDGNDRPTCQRCSRSRIPCTYVGRPRRRTSAMPAISAAFDPNDTAISVAEAETSDIDASALLPQRDHAAADLRHGGPEQQRGAPPQHAILLLIVVPRRADDAAEPDHGRHRGPQHRAAGRVVRVGSVAAAALPLRPAGAAPGARQDARPKRGWRANSGQDPDPLHRQRRQVPGAPATAAAVHDRGRGGWCAAAAEPAGAAYLWRSADKTASQTPPRFSSHVLTNMDRFRKHVYPILPVVPNAYLDAAHTTASSADAASTPVAVTALDTIPTAVLAAMYGLALPFALNDELLAVVSAFEQPAPLVQQLWTLVHALVQAAMHRPSLSTVQAALLFLHGASGGGGDDQSSSAFLWSFVGSTVGMAHNLGLQVECRMFGIPHADKRLRRRLWWALYIEDKWQSLLMGRPPYIRADEWDVGELCDGDFEVPAAASSYFDEAAATTGRTFGPFRDMARLAVIVADVQEKLYSLQACQRLAEDLALSISTAKPLFDQLNDWRSSISAAAAAPEPFHDDTGSGGAYPTTAYFAYLTVVTYVWRALLRPTVRSSPPPRIIDVEELPPPPPPPDVGGFFFEELSWDLSDLPEMELHLEEDQGAAHAHGDASGSSSATIKELHQAAQAYGGTVAAFTARLTSRHFDEFWYSWSRIGFAVVSNFLTVLLVQAPTAENTPRAKWMLESWRQTLRHQSRAFPILRLAMARLNAFYWGSSEMSTGTANQQQQPCNTAWSEHEEPPPYEKKERLPPSYHDIKRADRHAATGWKGALRRMFPLERRFETVTLGRHTTSTSRGM
ncbi:fungal specific transcription factor [Cordyceps fumosorosea ARSEF 2679]|uniref:Fungal specific transcription factor n=1 Tax=Cordyceps fumosorosea (strain ARSEF 2679) TaxID=1081104 RepID=A0A167LJ71_CORFA|nr:fungal specific transcription factor [Cordyceps fumosorosea ARSEF 2679]OAA53146.1 fungal specific transcription factor [Cordyceps fumosorosea ARSEF 2679]